MKKLTAVIILIAAVAVSGCQAPPAQKEAAELKGREEQAEIVKEQEKEDGMLEIFESMIASGADAGELGIFMRENISLVSKGDAERMLELLVIEQQGMIERINGLVFRPEYMDALNVDMNGILDRELISSISNEKVRDDFQSMADGFLTLVRYEETPSVETDWEEINGLSEYFSDDFAEMARLFDKMQNYRYNRNEPDFETIYADAARTEELILGNDESFLTWQSDKLYKKQIGNLFIGPEGSYFGAFISKAGEPYESLIAASKKYPDSALTSLVMELDEGENADFTDIVDKVDAFAAFGLNSPANAVWVRVDGGETLQGMLYVSMEGDSIAEKRINDKINETATGLKDSLGIEDGTSYMNMLMFGNRNYLSMIISASGTDENGDFKYKERRMVMDMNTGGDMRITDFLGMPWDDLRPQLEEITGKQIDLISGFNIDRAGLSLIIERDGSEYSDYAVVTFDELTDYVPMEAFYK